MKWLLLLLAALLTASCSLDDFLFNEEKITEYNLSTAVIPESSRTLYTFASGGHTLYGYFVVPADSVDLRLTLLYCHGNKQHLGEYWNRVELYYRMGFRVFIFDYRGFGRSEGRSSQNSLYEDGRAALSFLHDSLRVDRQAIIYYGYSLGNVISIYLAAEADTPAALIAEAPFASGEALVRTATLLDLPGGYLLDGEFDNIRYIRRIGTRYLQFHGDVDDFVPWESNGRIVFENAPGRTSLELVRGANHENIPDVMGFENYRDRILNFLTLRE